jgi:hypothetical protein
MAITFIGRGSNRGNGVGSVNLPAGVQAGDFALVAWSRALSESIVDLSGWTAIAGGNAPAVTHILWKFLTQAEINTGSLTFFFDGSSFASCALNVYRGVAGINPIHRFAAGGTQATSTSYQFAQPITANDNCMIVYIGRYEIVNAGTVISYSGSGLTLGGGYIDTGPGGGRVGSAYELQNAAGPVDSVTLISGLASTLFGFVVALAPDLPPSAPTGIAVSPVTPDGVATITYTKGVDPEGDAVTTVGEISTDNGGSYQPFFTSGVNSESVQVDFSSVAATTQAKLRLKSTAKGLSSAYTVFGPFTIEHAPSAPNVLTPTAGITRTIGVAYDITWERSTSSVYAPSQLHYEVQLSTAGNNEASYQSVPGSPTGNNITVINYNFAGKLPGGNNYIRVRAVDPAGKASAWRVVGPFTLVADVNPQPPTNPRAVQGGVTIVTGGTFDRLGTVAIQADFNDPGDAMNAYEIKWSTDGGATFPNTTGVVAAAAVNHNFAGNTFPRQMIYFQVFTRDAGNKWNLAPASFNLRAGEKPAAPVFTSPLNGGTVGDSQPVATWTSTEQQAFELRVMTLANVQEWTGGVEVSANTTRQIGVNPTFQQANGSQHKYGLKTRNSEGLWSNETVITVTVQFTAPLKPTGQVTPLPLQGLNSLAITNPAGGTTATANNDIFRYEVTKGIGTKIRIKSGVLPNTTFQDKRAASGVQYGYVIRAKAANGLITDSDPIIAPLLKLRGVWLEIINTGELFSFFTMQQDETRMNAGSIVEVDGINDEDPNEPVLPVGIFFKRQKIGLRYAVLARKNKGERENLIKIHKAQSSVMVRDSRGNKFACAWHDFSAVYAFSGDVVTLPLNAVRFTENLDANRTV